MSDAKQKGFEDYGKEVCLVRRDLRGRLQWSTVDVPENPEVWANDYIGGWTQAYREDSKRDD